MRFAPNGTISTVPKAEWEKAKALVKEGLEAITEEQPGSEGSFKNPTGDFWVGVSIAFFSAA